MPARKRRRDLTGASATDAHNPAQNQAQIAGLHEAAARALRLHDWPEPPPSSEPLPESASAPEAAPARPDKRRLWPFGRKRDAEAERRAAILAELEASIAGRPRAAARVLDASARALDAEARPAAERLRAAS
jgi:hypothetical protein